MWGAILWLGFSLCAADRAAESKIETGSGFLAVPSPLGLEAPSANLTAPRAELAVPSADMQPPPVQVQPPEGDMDVPAAQLDAPQPALKIPQAPSSLEAGNIKKPEKPLRTSAGTSDIFISGKIATANDSDDQLAKIPKYKKEWLAALVQETGGLLQDLLPGESAAGAVRRRLPPSIESGEFLQAVFLIDNSEGPGSEPMRHGKLEWQIEQAIKSLGSLEDVSFDISHYNNPQVHDQASPDSAGGPPLAGRASPEALRRGAQEDHWDNAWAAISEYMWFEREAPGTRLIFIITDEEGTVGPGHKTYKEIVKESKDKGIHFEVLRVLGKPGDGIFHFSPTITPVDGPALNLAAAQKILSYPLGWGWRFSPKERMLAVQRLGQARSSRLISFLDSAIDPSLEKDGEVRLRAALALGDIGEKEALAYLMQAVNPMKEPLAQVRLAAVWAITQIGGREAAQVLAKTAGPQAEPDAEVRRQAVLGLADFNGSGHPSALLDFLDPEREPDKDLKILMREFREKIYNNSQ